MRCNIQKILYDLYALPKLHVFDNKPFSNLVKQNNKQCNYVIKHKGNLHINSLPLNFSTYKIKTTDFINLSKKTPTNSKVQLKNSD
ncbi:hypothetical protein JCM21738_4094 [Mesobacillus boroniphilus JCM 21738]|uniref:Uncharacterized protein n=1 Tax=Mesobacillus boroniphilus JCM 21738 TaxID=1294265 RepID=W4RU20_9BACI|nr:hypothetical protein JCM21738_4094 [Mesobacillus boroniphilus JCM 21738]